MIKQFPLLALVLMVSGSSLAQELTPALQSMVNAEIAFANYSKEKNTRDAFLAYLTDSTVLFDKSGPIIGKKSWETLTPNNSLLYWRPVFVGISRDGGIGFSTGPWEWSADKKDPKPAAFGYYATIWEKSADGWKMAVDIGCPFQGPESNTAMLHASNPIGAAAEPKEIAAANFSRADALYSEKLNSQFKGSLSDFFTKDALMLRPGMMPEYFPFKNLTASDPKVRFIKVGSGVSSSGDLAYSYGKLEEEAKDGTVGSVKASFLRVWKKENTSWKIVLDVVGSPN